MTGLTRTLDQLIFGFILATQIHLLYNTAMTDYLKFSIFFSFLEMFKGMTTENVIGDSMNGKLVECFYQYITSAAFIYNISKIVGLFLILVEFEHISQQLVRNEVEYVGLEFCFVFFTN